MTTRSNLHLLIATLMVVLSACGGGGGGDSGGGGTSPPPPPPVFSSALDFLAPTSFANGQSYVTEGLSVSISGELNSETIPRGFCPDSQPPQNYSVRWSNAANGQSGTAPIAIGCVTIVGIPGIKSQFTTDLIPLEPDNNRVTIDTFQGTTQIGRDVITIVREDNVPPSISFAHPADGQQAVPTDYALVVVFSEPMNPSTMTADRYVVLGAGSAPVTGQVEYLSANNAWIFRPAAPLAADSSYSVTISGVVEDAAGGNALGDDVSWTFVTGPGADDTAPNVNVQWPGSNCHCAPVSTRILAGLDEFADPAYVTAGTVSVTTAGTPVAGATVYRGDFLEFVPDSELLPGQTYAVTVSGALSDPAGLMMVADHVWEFTTDSRAPAGSWFETSQDQPPPAMAGAIAVWTGTEVLIWGHGGGGSYNPAADDWNTGTAISVDGPSPRFGYSAVWTGNEMIVWGGRASVLTDAEIFGGGGDFNVSSNTWTDIAPPNSPGSYATYDHVAVWTGMEMIVWGGRAITSGSLPQPVNSGWRYHPGTGVATAFTGANAPSPRASAHAVWTGAEMIVWGGFDETGSPLNDGARYDPVADAWTPLPPVAATVVQGIATSAVWTGNEMILWDGGQTEQDQTLNDRLRVPTLHVYDPLQDSWRVSTSGWEPYLAGANPILVSFASSGYRAFWTGDRMFVAGFYAGDRSYLYDPVADSWQIVTDVQGLGREGAAAAWAGSRFVIWGGATGVLPGNDGLVFQP
jgi:hypothetical protein